MSGVAFTLFYSLRKPSIQRLENHGLGTFDPKAVGYLACGSFTRHQDAVFGMLHSSVGELDQARHGRMLVSWTG